MPESAGNGRSDSAQAAFTVRTWMIAVIIALIGQLGVSVWWGATLTANQMHLQTQVEQMNKRLESAAGANYTTQDARVDKSAWMQLHETQADQIAALRSDLLDLKQSLR